MHRIQFRETVEILGVVSIVASLLLVAWQVRQSNRIAGADIRLQLTQEYNELHRIRLTSPDFAKLYPKLAAPQNHLITATENSQMEALAWHYVNIYSSAQLAYDNGLLSREQFEIYIAGATWLVDAYPGMHSQLINIYGILPMLQTSEVFQPIAELAARQQEESSESQ